MTNVYTLKNINNKDNDSFKEVEQRLGGTYEQELKEKLYSAIKSKAEINDLSKKLVDKYNEREKEFENKASQLNASTTKVRSQLISERKSHCEANREATLAQKASFDDKVQILSLEVKVRELELERANEDLNSKNYTIECMEKGIEASDSIYKWELDIRSSERLKLMEENSSLKDQLVLKKDNKVDTPLPPMNDSSQLGPEGTPSAFNHLSHIISVSGAEAVSLPETAPIITSPLRSPMLIYSILALVLITIICFMARKWLNSWKKDSRYFSHENTQIGWE
ncbi:unnamed protein product [Rhizophagus irregularis]|uniref:Uncharacterized protein n=1 Tax=Rhizophagus irregularis TaxID=588596 RepID=A0A916A1F5_9GLOM|nr:unnamed protein product [Rhizophagus irregularis]CAB5395148.1 unnamed protein product [Rhizophagus irregularis]